MSNQKDMFIWSDSITLTESVFKKVDKFKDENNMISEELISSCISLCANISYGNAIKNDSEFIKHLYICAGKLAKIETLLEISKKIKLCTTYSHLQEQIDKLKAETYGFIKYLKNKTK